MQEPRILQQMILGLVLMAPGMAQGGRTLSHSEGGITHSIWVPDGYVEVLWPESPGADLRADMKQSFATIGKKMDSIAVLVTKKDLAIYDSGGVSPMRGHYIYFTWVPGQKMPSASGLRDMLVPYAGKSGKFIEAMKSSSAATNWIKQNINKGEMLPLGILRQWNDGYILSMVIGFDMTIEGKTHRIAKIKSSAYQERGNGHYVVEYVTLQDYGTRFQQGLDRAMAIAKGTRNSPSR